MRRAVLEEGEEDLQLEESISRLADSTPLVSARRLLVSRQRRLLVAFAAALVVGLVVSPVDTMSVLFGIITLLYVASTAYRVFIYARSTGPSVLEQVSDEEALRVPEEELPRYTILVPAYHEAMMAASIVRHLSAIEYPADRLDVKFLVEADDADTIAAFTELEVGDQFELVRIPPAEPRTKPKALNFGLSLARGELVTVYDVEDEPDPLQLRRAVVAFSRLGPEVGCLQAQLAYSNPLQNIITRWFTIEYEMWFSLYLPGLVSLGAPIPLGGTSNHFRKEVLESVGAWDPYNVTEDADLGVRMYRKGLQVRILDSHTYEEANSDFVNWVRQRSRWYKGYAQTFLVHVREPQKLTREIGWKNVVQFCLFVGGTPALSLLNPVFWALTVIWFVAHPQFILSTFPAPVYYVGLCCFVLGNFLMSYLTVLCCRRMREPELLVAALIVPIYWAMMGVAAVKGVLQIVLAPSLWEKTVHGLRPDPSILPEGLPS